MRAKGCCPADGIVSFRTVSRPQSLGVLLLSVTGMFWFGGRFSLFDTVALLVCGLAAGAALAALAAARQKTR